MISSVCLWSFEKIPSTQTKPYEAKCRSQWEQFQKLLSADISHLQAKIYKL